MLTLVDLLEVDVDLRRQDTTTVGVGAWGWHGFGRPGSNKLLVHYGWRVLVFRFFVVFVTIFVIPFFCELKRTGRVPLYHYW